jgi:poly [ADP-ribose] polymerase
MPLGNLSQKQIKEAFSVLTQLQKLLKKQGDSNRQVLVDRTNKFYTLVPHDCGIDNPPLLDNEDIIKQKIEMLNSLMEIEIAYKLLQLEDESDNPIDSHYSKLQTDITVLDKDSEEFKFIELYVTNTHAKTHQNYSLKIEEVFKIERNGEAARYKKFNKLPNKKLLWHGSRLTNFAGILSQVYSVCQCKLNYFLGDNFPNIQLLFLFRV